MRPKILIGIKSIDEIKSSSFFYVLGYEKFTYFSAHNFRYEEIEKIEEKSRVYILLNSLIHEKEIDDAKCEVNRLMKLGVNFIIQDLGLVSYIKNSGYQKDVIYYPYTLLSNSEEIATFNEINIDTGISPYLNPLEYKEVKDYSHSLVTIFGYIPLYQTYRRIISLYNEKYKENCKKNHVFLKENERNELMPIEENSYGTMIFKSEPINLSDRLHYFKNAKYWYLDSNLVENDEFNKIVEKVNNYEED